MLTTVHPGYFLRQRTCVIATALCGFIPALFAESGQTAADEQLAVRNNDVVVFLGDDLMDTPNPARNTTFPVLVETFLAARYPALRIQYIPAAWAEDTTARALLRLERDVLSRKPTVVVICLGMNEPALRADGENPERLVQFKNNLSQIVQDCQKAGARVWLISPSCGREEPGQTTRIGSGAKPAFADLATVGYNKIMALYADTIQEVAKNSNSGYVNWYQAMLDARHSLAENEDDLHSRQEHRIPLSRGHALAATLLLKAWGADPIQAAVEIDWAANTGKIVTANPSLATGGVTITAENERKIIIINGLPLPWPMPGDRLSAIQPHWEAALMSKIILKISNPPNRGMRIKQETADGITRGDLLVSAEQLRHGFNLAAAEPVRSIEDARDLLNLIQQKNSYRYGAWRRLELEPPKEPELVSPQRELLHAWLSYAAAYEEIISKRPRVFDIKLILAEAVTEDVLPTSQPFRSASRPTTGPKPAPLQAPPRGKP